MKLGLLISGNLGEIVLQHLLKSEHEVVFIFTDKNSFNIIDICNINNIHIFIGNPRINSYTQFIRDKPIDLLISVNYLFIIDKQLIEHPKKFAFNIHGSLLPKYRGRTPHVWAIINNEKEAGITAHLIDESCDTGDIIYQVKVQIGENETGYSLLIKYHDLYIMIIDEILRNVSMNKSIITIPQNNLHATYFGKRVPEDGLINWNWQKERIKNWIRAQAFPYPGAFSIINGHKVIIDEIQFTEFGFNYDMPNGMILDINPFIIKTPNGVIEITKVREGKIYCTKGNQFFEK